jgi:EAL domain-containing protein (putative c-di-GMP-specific phosphodiesterase class I)
MPFDVVRLDASLLDDLSPSGDVRRQLAAVVELVHAHGMTCLAEGVERPEQLSQLREAGCDLFQGPLLGDAVPLVASSPARVTPSVSSSAS